jgi:CubicO group peptidase (beta-lactamase class C family)
MWGRRGFLKAASVGIASIGSGRAFAQDDEPKTKETPKPKASAKTPAKAKTKEAEPLKANETLNRILAPIRDNHQFPGLIGGIVTGATLSSIGVVGIRKVGSSEPFRVDDQIHLGSDTKAMTATLIGMLVEEGKLDWQSTLRDIFPSQTSKLNKDVAAITLLDLLTHRAGLPHDPTPFWWELPGQTPTEQRRSLLGQPLQAPLLSKPGTKFEYSNLGYALAGLMAEQVTKTSWEDLMRRRLFKPLDMPSAGFGPPGQKGKVDQPWGHVRRNKAVVPIQGDNAPSLGPAGTVHCTVPDWAKFASLHLQAAEGKPRLLKASTYKVLHHSPRGQNYAAGWGVTEQSEGNVLSHNGSNTMWYASILIVPSANFAILAATNYGGDGADKGIDQAVQELIKYHAGNRPRTRRR